MRRERPSIKRDLQPRQMASYFTEMKPATTLSSNIASLHIRFDIGALVYCLYNIL